MSSNIVLLPRSPEEAAEQERNQRLFQWCRDLLDKLGYVQRVKEALTFEELRKIVFNADAAEAKLAFRAALHPASGSRASMFVGLKEKTLARIVANRLDDLRKDREKELARGGGAGSNSGATLNWTADLKIDDEGGVKPLLTNLILFLRYHEEWKGVLAYDEFNARVVIRERPSWGDEAPDAPWTDHHESQARVWFQNEDIAAAQGDVGRAVQAAARHNPFHPVRDYFEALVWDGTPRLDAWLITYLHADDTEYVRAVGPRFLISAVARIYKPGAQVDHMLVLEESQGKLKSTALRTLAIRDEWFTDRISQIGSKDSLLETAGVLLFEIAELNALIRASASTSKGFLTQRHDRFRPPYGKYPIVLPRQCVFAGTINPPVGGYLKDPTGARRFWPVACHGMIDCDGIERDRGQLWAEAVGRFKAGAPWWLETPELEALATAEQAARFKTDAWQEPIERWIGKRKETSVSDVLNGALEIPPSGQSRSAEMRVASILTHLGFAKYRAGSDGTRKNRYRRT